MYDAIDMAPAIAYDYQRADAFALKKRIRADVAQMAERDPSKFDVAGSIPAVRSTTTPATPSNGLGHPGRAHHRGLLFSSWPYRQFASRLSTGRWLFSFGATMAKKCVEIELDTETGEFTVAECSPKDEAMSGEEDGEPAGQAFKSPEEAMRAAMQILTDDGATPEEQAQAGYDKGAKPASTRPAVGEVFGEGM